jgi:hypothetical protein
MQDISPPKRLHSVSTIVTHRSIFVTSLPAIHCSNSDWFYVTSLICLLCVTFRNIFLVTRSQCHLHTPLLTKGDSCHANAHSSPSLCLLSLISCELGRGRTSSNEGGKYRKQKQTLRAIQTYLYLNGTQDKGTP